MTSSRIWTVGAVVLIAAILALGWLLGVAPLLGQSAAADLERASVETQNIAQRATLEQMQADFGRLDEIETELGELRSSIPAEEATDLFAIAVERAALANDVFLTSFVASEMPFLGAEGASASPGVGGVAMQTAAGSVYAIPVTIGLEGEDVGLLGALRDLQMLPRLFVVNSITITGPSISTEQPTATISGYILLLTDRALAPTPEDAAVAPAAENTSNYEVPDLDEALPDWLGGGDEAGNDGATPTPTPTPTP